MKFKVFKDEKLVNTIVANETFVENFCNVNGFTYEMVEEQTMAVVPGDQPTQLDRIEAQVTYTAMMTDTLLEE